MNPYIKHSLNTADYRFFSPRKEKFISFPIIQRMYNEFRFIDTILDEGIVRAILDGTYEIRNEGH